MKKIYNRRLRKSALEDIIEIRIEKNKRPQKDKISNVMYLMKTHQERYIMKKFVLKEEDIKHYIKYKKLR